MPTFMLVIATFSSNMKLFDRPNQYNLGEINLCLTEKQP